MHDCVDIQLASPWPDGFRLVGGPEKFKIFYEFTINSMAYTSHSFTIDNTRKATEIITAHPLFRRERENGIDINEWADVLFNTMKDINLWL